MRVTVNDLKDTIEYINGLLSDYGYNWHLVYYGAYRYHDVKKQYNGETSIINITPDSTTTTREVYAWLRGFIVGLQRD